MAVKIHRQETEQDGQVLTIVLTGHLGIATYGDFKSFREYIDTSRKIILDMAELDYLGSSALSMLLMLREHARRAGTQIEIVHCSHTVHKILTTVKFDELFDLPPPE